MIFGKWRQYLNNLSRNTRGRAAGPKRARPARPGLELLEDRVTPAVIAVFDASAGVLTVTGDDAANQITVSVNKADQVVVKDNGVKVAITDLSGDHILKPLVSATTLIQVDGKAGNDAITINGGLPNAFLFGGDGNDVLKGGSGDDYFEGGSGNDKMFGAGGIDWMFGGNDKDVLDGGSGNDHLFGDDGADVLLGGVGNDELTGGLGIDVLNGGPGADHKVDPIEV